MTDVIDVRITSQDPDGGRGPRPGPPSLGPAAPVVTLHIGSARTIARTRPLGGSLVRLTLRDALPLHAGRPGAAARSRRGQAGGGTGRGGTGRDGASWPHRPGRRPGRRRGTPAVTWPPGLRCSAAWCSTWCRRPDPPRRRSRSGQGTAFLAGRPDCGRPAAPPWPAAGGRAAGHGHHRAAGAGGGRVAGRSWLPGRAHGASGGGGRCHADREPLASGMPLDAARAMLGLPDRRLVEAWCGRRFRSAAAWGSAWPARPAEPGLPDAVDTAVRLLRADLADAPFLAPDSARLRRARTGPQGTGRRRQGGPAAADQRADRARARCRRRRRPDPGRAAAAVHRRRGTAGAAHHAADRDTAA